MRTFFDGDCGKAPNTANGLYISKWPKSTKLLEKPEIFSQDHYQGVPDETEHAIQLRKFRLNGKAYF
jgi:hypothetical protein